MSKKKYNVVKLMFKSPLHIGTNTGATYAASGGILHSDTISGAIASTYVSLSGNSDVIDFMNGFKLSSAYPFSGEHYFLPKPMMQLPFEFTDIDEMKLSKKLKKLEYIESETFSEIIQGKSLKIKAEHFSNAGKYLWENKPESEVKIVSGVQQKVMIPRSDFGDAEPYCLDRLYFGKDTGLFFFVEWENDSIMNRFKSCIRFLEDMGFGTDKSVGNGQFTTDYSELILNVPDNPHQQMLLSLYCPEKAEIDTNILVTSTYILLQRNGFIAGSNYEGLRHLRKRSVYMFCEGSVINTNEIKGRIVDLKPDFNHPDIHPVYRDGRAFCIPFKQNSEIG